VSFSVLTACFLRLLSGARCVAAARTVLKRRPVHVGDNCSRLLIALPTLLLVCAAALSPTRADTRSSASATPTRADAQSSASATPTRADAQSSPSATPTRADAQSHPSSTPTRIDAQNAVHEGTFETPPAPASSSRPAPGAAERKSVPTALAVVEQPRATGYFVGDRVTQRVLLERGGHAVVPVTLPTPGRVSAWFERRAASVETDASSHRWLVVQYQILNAPSKLITVKLPAWTLAIKSDPSLSSAGRDRGASAGASIGAELGKVRALQIPETLVNVAPLSLPGSPTQVGSADLRADRLPPTIAVSPIRRAMAISAGALVLTLVAWFAWIMWRNWRAEATQPFASALREMRTLEDSEPRAWQALHRAFDRTAGRVVQSATLPTLFERAPQLLPARGEIERFFAQSSLLFFGAAPASPAPSASSGSPASAAPFVTSGSPASAAPFASSAAPTSAATSASSAAPASPALSASSDASASGSPPTPSPRGLCIELRRIEKRHER
jgi:mxaA protein